jgi:hypothetical protein
MMTMMKQINLNAAYLIEIELRDREAGVKFACYDTDCSPRTYISVSWGIL